MNKTITIQEPLKVKIGQETMILLPFKFWQKLEDYFEDQEALSSNKYLRKIQKARTEIKKGKLIYPFN